MPAGRPLIGRERTQGYSITLEPSIAQLLRTIGNGNLSAGIAQAARALIRSAAVQVDACIKALPLTNGENPMTSKHFVAIACAMANLKPERGAALSAWRNAVHALADVCSTSNSRFDRARFYEACGLEVAND